MNAGRKDGMVRMKLTISREEHPEMFDALISIRSPRRRTGRLKELVIKALTLEQVGATAVLGPLLVDGARSGVAPIGEAARAGPPTTSVTSMLEWVGSQT
ncbi:MAG: hypothetical protein Q8L49_07520 [Burkholderiaceae bacterium]|nr:hypothetical protein [Burkholderiaceae bacterium]